MTINIFKTPNKELREDLEKGLAANDWYCLCAIEKSPDTRCMCKKFREAGAGPCDCGLYIKEIKED